MITKTNLWITSAGKSIIQAKPLFKKMNHKLKADTVGKIPRTKSTKALTSPGSTVITLK